MTSILANAGTALMWMSMFHVVFGNLILGVVEGVLVAKVFKTKMWRSIALLILANYASSLAGNFFFTQSNELLADRLTIENVFSWFLLLLGVAFLLTLVIEFPFFRWAMKGSEAGSSLLKSVKAIVIIHGISYSLLVGLFWSVSGTTMMTRFDVVPPGKLTSDLDFDLYYIVPDGDLVKRMRIQSGEESEVASIESKGVHDRLFVRKGKSKTFDLFIVTQSSDRRGLERLLVEDFSNNAVLERAVEEGRADRIDDTWMNIGEVPSFVSQSKWDFFMGFWPAGGLRYQQKEDGVRRRAALEIFIAFWTVRNAIELEEGLVLFQLGRNQICLIDVEMKQIALIVRGRGPVATRTGETGLN